MTTPIINAPTLAQDRAAAFVLLKPHGSYTAQEIDAIAAAYWIHARACGVDPGVAWAQMCHETGYLSSWWSQPPRMNPAGIGVNGAKSDTQPVGAWANRDGIWEAGCSFPAGWAAQAIPAHVGRLVAYAVKSPDRTPAQRAYVLMAEAARPLPFHLHGRCPSVEDLGGKWAKDEGYGGRLVTLLGIMRGK